MSMREITAKEWEGYPDCYKGIFNDFYGDFPHLKGKRTLLVLDRKTGGTVLIIEGGLFRIA